MAICKLTDPGSLQMRAIEQARSSSPHSLDIVPQDFIDKFVSKFTTFKTLRFAIRDNPGFLSVRTHEQFHGKRRQRAVVVMSQAADFQGATLCPPSGLVTIQS